MGVKEQKLPARPYKQDERTFGYNITFNLLYDMGANPNIRIITDIYEKDFQSRKQAYEFFKFLGEIPKDKEKIYRANVDKYVFETKNGFRFEQKARSYLMWWDTREIRKGK